MLERLGEPVVVAGKQAAVLVPQRAVDVARVALALVVLGHERERVSVLPGDLAGAVLVDRVVVGHLQRSRVAEVHLVLAEVALALGVLDRDAGARHAQADRPQHLLDHRGAEDRVVDVVGVGRRDVVIALRPRLVVAVAKQEELELGADVGRPASLGQPVELAAQDLPWRGQHRRSVLPLEIGHHKRGSLQPGDRPQRRHVRLEDEVAVARVPRRHLVALHRVHLDVHREQVVAALRAVPCDVRQKEGRVHALAHQPPLHVGHHQQHGVDRARLHLTLKLVKSHARSLFLAGGPIHILRAVCTATGR